MPAWSKNITIRRRSLYFTSPALAGAMVAGAFAGVATGVASGFTAAAPPRAAGGGGCEIGRFFQPLELEDFDLLRFAVFGDGEVGGLEPIERRSVLVLGGDVDHY